MLSPCRLSLTTAPFPSQNFMKTLMKMFAEQDKGVLFYETVVSFKQQRHTYIEACVADPSRLPVSRAQRAQS